MPYKKRSKSYSNARPGYKRCGKMVLSDAAKALALARHIKKLVNVEIKNHDVQLASVAITDTPLITQLSNIAQGDTTNTRDGAQAKMLGVNVNYILTRSTNAEATAVRVMLVIDKQTNQAIYTAADLLEDVTSIDNVVSPRNLDNLHRFQILYDKVHVLTTNTTQIVVRKYFTKQLLLRYDGSTPSIADLTQNSLSILLVATQVTNDPSIAAFFRVRFVDN